jgi:UDP-N-acetylglucosamine 1-carboxyvinyltransferase
MNEMKILGGEGVKGEIKISGAKNSVLPIMCATLLSGKNTVLTNVPNVSDVQTLTDILSRLGSKIDCSTNALSITNGDITSTKATYEMVEKMRASVLILGPLLARFGHCEISLPGGCAIGARPVDLHLRAMEALGAEIVIHDGYVSAKAERGLVGADIIFDKVTVGGTENTIMAASLANGKTTITNAAREPEIVQLCEYIKAGGVDIQGIGSSELTIFGTNGKLLDLPSVHIIPDRIEAGTYLCAAAITGKKTKLVGINPSHIINIIAKLQEMGCEIELNENEIVIYREQELRPVTITTMEYPGFPTDMQAQFMAVLTQAIGTSQITENLFENRFMNVPELRRMGAKIQIYNNTATIIGPVNLEATNVKATDLRGGASLIIAALAAEGKTVIHDVHHILRGYDDIVRKLEQAGVDCELV